MSEDRTERLNEILAEILQPFYEKLEKIEKAIERLEKQNEE